MKKWMLIPGVLVVAALIAWGATSLGGGSKTGYRFVEVTRGDVVSSVSSTGTLQALTTVQVGTQVSGKVSDIYVDFNDHVKKGQLIARIDPTLLEQAVRSAEADLERNRAELEQSQRDFDRISRLYQSKVVTESDFNAAEYKLAVAKASMKSAEISLERAQQNLGYSEIHSPIDGVILDRSVDEGQTVAASFSAPQLFLIAEVLSAMEILASVDESDIGLIQEGQDVQFTVQAYPDESFKGVVKQVRLQSTTQENVVNYTVAIAVQNPGGRLLPGMTATVDFIVSQATDVLMVPNAALRFRPTAEMWAAFRSQRQGQGSRGGAGEREAARREGPPAAAGAEASPASGGRETNAEQRSFGGGQGGFGGRSADRALLWILDENGHVTALPVRTGITDGQSTEVSSPRVQEGQQVIAGITTSATSATTNPFQGEQRGGPRGFRRGAGPGM
jgi:HlyD family secretion protein